MKDLHIILIGAGIFVLAIIIFFVLKIFIPVWIYFLIIFFFLISLALLYFSGYLFSDSLMSSGSDAIDIAAHIRTVFANRFEVLPFRLGNFIKYSEYYHEAKNKQYYGFVFETDPITREIVVIWNDTDKKFAYINFDPDIDEIYDPFARFNPYKEVVRYKPPEKRVTHYYYKKPKKRGNLLNIDEEEEEEDEEE